MHIRLSQAAILVCFALLRSVSAHASNAEYHDWQSYVNVRYQYVICYPEDLLSPQGEAPNRDGQKFLAKDGAQLIVFGQNNPLDESLNDMPLDESLKDLLADTESRLAGPSGKITYKVLKPSWFVISGQKGQIVFYAKTHYYRDQFKSFELTYDESVASVYEPIIGRLNTCFADLAG